jgi:hypothetical protein
MSGRPESLRDDEDEEKSRALVLMIGASTATHVSFVPLPRPELYVLSYSALNAFT